jgi:hypothetical protein
MSAVLRTASSHVAATSDSICRACASPTTPERYWPIAMASVSPRVSSSNPPR